MLIGIKTKQRGFTLLERNWRDRNSEAVFSITGIYKFANRLEYSKCVGVCRETRHFLCPDFTERKCHCGERTHSLAKSCDTSDHIL